MEVLRSTTSTPSTPTFGARRCLLCRADFACRLDDGKAWEEGRSDMEKLSVVVDAVVVLAVAGPQWWSSKLLCHGCDLALDEISRALSHRVAIRRCFLANVAQLHSCDVIAPAEPPSPQQDALPRGGPAPHANRSNADGSGCSISGSVDRKADNAAKTSRLVADDAASHSCTLGLSAVTDDARSNPFEANQPVSPRYRVPTSLGGSDGSTEVTSIEPKRTGTVSHQGHIIMPADCQGHLLGFKDAESTNYAERQKCHSSSGYPDRCQQPQKRKPTAREQLFDEANGRPVRKLSRLLETLSAAASAAAAAAAAASLTPNDGGDLPRTTAIPVHTPSTKSAAEAMRCARPQAAASLDSCEGDTSASTALRRLSLVLDPGNITANRQVLLGTNTSSPSPTEKDETRKDVLRPCCNIPRCNIPCGNTESAAAARVPAAEHHKSLTAETYNGSSKSCDLARTSANTTDVDGHLLTPQVTGVGLVPVEAHIVMGAANFDCSACQKIASGNEAVGDKQSSAELATTGRGTAFHASAAERAGGRGRIEAEIDACTTAEFSQVLLHKQLRQQQQLKEHQTQCSSSTGFATLREQLRSSPAAAAGPAISTSAMQHVGLRPCHQATSDTPEQRACLHQAKPISAPCALAMPPPVSTRSGAVPLPAAVMGTTEHAEPNGIVATSAVLPKRLPTDQSSARGSPSLRAACTPTSGARSSPLSSISSDSLTQSTAAEHQPQHPQVASSNVALSSAVHGKPEVTSRVPLQPCLQSVPQTSSPKSREPAGNSVCHPALLMAMTSRDVDVHSCSERHGIQAEIAQRNGSVSSPSSEQQQRLESPAWCVDAKSNAVAKSSHDVSKVSTVATGGVVAAAEIDRSETLSPQTKVSGTAKHGPLKLPERGSAMTTLWKLLQQPAYTNGERGPLGPSVCTIGALPASEHPASTGQRSIVDTKTCNVVDLGVRNSCSSSRGAPNYSSKAPVAATTAGSLRAGGVPLSHLIRGAAARALVEAPLSAVRSSSDDCRLSPGAANCNGSSTAAGSATPLLAGMFERLSESPLPPSRRPLSHSAAQSAASGLVAEPRQLAQPGQPSHAAAALGRASPDFGRRVRRYPTNHRYSRFPSGGTGTGSSGLSHTSFANDPCRRRLIRTASVHRSSPNVFGVRPAAHRTLDSGEELADVCGDEVGCSGFSSNEFESSYGQQHHAHTTASATAGARGSGRNGETLLSPSLKELKSEPVDV